MPNDIRFLRRLIAPPYVDLTGDSEGSAACKRLAEHGLCRVVQDGPAWRVFQSDEQHRLSVATLAVALNS